MRLRNALERMFPAVLARRRPRFRVKPAVRPLEGRELLTGPTATMIQTATFPNLEALPNVATQAFLYFSSPMGTLTEVDVAISGSFSTQFAAENLGSASNMITGTTSANLAINVPSGAIPLSIPSITEKFTATPFDGTVTYDGTSGEEFASVTSNSATQTTVLTSPAALAAFTGSFRIPITVSGHAQGVATSTNGDISANFQTQTSVTVTVIYHYDPSLPSLDPTPAPTGGNSTGGQGSGSSSGTSGSSTGSTTTSSPSTVSSPAQTVQTATTTDQSTTTTTNHGKKKAPKVEAKPAQKVAKSPKTKKAGSKVKTH
jgi:hypothetical protein